MKRYTIPMLAVVMLLALAAPVGAAKPDKPGKPGTSGPVEVTLDANLGSVHAVGDEIYYTIDVTSSENISGAVVELSVNDEGAIALYDGKLEAGSTLSLEYSYIVAALPAKDIGASVTVLVGGEAMASASTSVGFWAIDECGFEESDAGLLTMTHPGGDCRYDFAPGYWTIVADPKRNIARRYPVMTMRDEVPGNWCTVGDPVNQDGTVTRYVDLPTENPFGEWWEVGVCALGGQGQCTEEGCFFPTANPATFVLTAPEGTVTATQLGDAPPSVP